MTESVETQVARQDEQLKALRDELRSGFDRLATAFEKHADEDRVQYGKIGHLEHAMTAVKAGWRTAVYFATGASVIVQTLFAYFHGGLPGH